MVFRHSCVTSVTFDSLNATLKMARSSSLAFSPRWQRNVGGMSSGPAAPFFFCFLRATSNLEFVSGERFAPLAAVLPRPQTGFGIPVDATFFLGKNQATFSGIVFHENVCFFGVVGDHLAFVRHGAVWLAGGWGTAKAVKNSPYFAGVRGMLLLLLCIETTSRSLPPGFKNEEG